MPHDFGGVAPSVPNLQGGTQQPTVPHARNTPFLLKYHPLRWQFCDGEWLPQLGRHKLDVGLNGVDARGDDSDARTNATKHGWTIIPDTAVPPGTPGGSYLRAYAAASGGHHHCLLWEVPQHFGGMILDSEIDTDGYRAFLRWLVDSGTVPPPSDPAIRLALNAKRKELEYALQNAGSRYDGPARVDATTATVQAMEATLAQPPERRAGSKAKPKAPKAAKVAEVAT